MIIAMNYRSIIDCWGSYTKLAKAIGVNPERARKWYERNNIPAEYWADILASARLRKIPLTADHMVIAAASKRDAA